MSMDGKGLSVVRKSTTTGSADDLRKVLIVDDDTLFRVGLEKVVSKEGFKAISASTGEKALKKVEEENPFLVLLDLRLPDSLDGLAVLEIIRKKHPEICVIIISGHTDIRGAVDAMKAGALDYLEKPIDFDRLKTILHSQKPGCSLRSRKSSVLSDFVYASEKMKNVIEVMQRLSFKSDLTVLVTGETGTGKSFLCKKIHELSPRRNKAYVQIGCANIPEPLIESELFGYEKGAFTDAKNSKEGLVEVANGGTLLLEELGEMPYPFQAKILGLLEEKRFRKIGALQDTEADVRILGATNRNLYEQVQAKKFRLDLFYRVNVASIELPPLRERFEDIPLLVQHFINSFGKKYNCKPKKINKEGMALLQHYSWPGNVRQLKNMIEKLVVLSDCDQIYPEDISSILLVQKEMEEKREEENVDIESFSGLSLKAMEEKHIRTALKLTGGNQRKAAQLLDITRDTLRYRLKKLGIG